jgi:PKD repeat protein
MRCSAAGGSHRFARALAAAFLIFCLPWIVFAGAQPGLFRVEVPGMVDALGLPVFAHLQGADGADYALVIAPFSVIESSGAEFTVLHEPGAKAAGKKYLIATERKEGAYGKALKSHEILHDDGRQTIIWATPQEAEALAGMGFEIAWLPEKPLVLGAPKAPLAAPLAGYDPVVAEQIGKVSVEEVKLLCGNLSGENTVKIGQTDHKITTRHTNNSQWQTLSTQYAHEFLQALGLETSYHNWNGTRRNVIAQKKGSSKAGEIVLITAHLDDMPASGAAPGADDNASGSVAVLLAAKVMKDYAFERTLRFVLFTGEEQGLLGSAKYAADAAAAGDSIVAVLNLDMIAWDKSGGPVLRLHTRTSGNPGYPADKQIADQFIAVVNDYGLGGLLEPLLDPDGISASDHYSFWVEGIPGILAIEDDLNDFNAYYHTANDKLDKLNLGYFTNFVKAALGTTAHLAAPVHEGLHAAFGYSADQLKVSFSDQSTCTGCSISSWEWDFGDGSTSAVKDPVHAYAQEGAYTVTLKVAGSANQTDSVSKTVTVKQNLAYCAAKGGSQAYEWIAGVKAGAFQKTSGASAYSDYTTEVIEADTGQTIAVSLKPGFKSSSYIEYWRVWADLNRDGDFEDPGEKLLEKAGGGEVGGNITLPAAAAPGATRLRVAMSYSSYPNPCGTFSYGEVEDYTLKVGGGAPAPVAAFSYVADGLAVKFTDSSQAPGGSIQGWQWDFGDGGQSDRPNPAHLYDVAGTYTVTLTVTDAKGASDSEAKTITVGAAGPDYCESAGSDQDYEWIAAVDFGGFSWSSEASGYSDFSALMVEAVKGQSVPVKLTPGYPGSTHYEERWRIWADFNRDGDFDDAGEKLFEKTGAGAVSGTIAIPATAPGGVTRLRVSMGYDSYPAPCGGFPYGEVEDYSLNVK